VVDFAGAVVERGTIQGNGAIIALSSNEVDPNLNTFIDYHATRKASQSAPACEHGSNTPMRALDDVTDACDGQYKLLSLDSIHPFVRGW
jgi:hypothetical protein